MKELKTAEVIAHRGIKGDRYCMRKGTYSVFRTSTKHPGRREPGRQLTIVAAEGVEAALITHGIKAFGSLGDFRRNIVTRGVPAEVLQNAVGRRFVLATRSSFSRTVSASRASTMSARIAGTA